MRKFIFEGYFSGASPHYENFTITAENEVEARAKIEKEILASQENPKNIFYLEDGKKCRYSTFCGLTLRETEFD